VLDSIGTSIPRRKPGDRSEHIILENVYTTVVGAQIIYLLVPTGHPKIFANELDCVKRIRKGYAIAAESRLLELANAWRIIRSLTARRCSLQHADR
jgi:hypothetical protein